MRRRPDILLILAAAFGLGVIATFLLPMTSSDTVASPVSELQKGFVLEE